MNLALKQLAELRHVDYDRLLEEIIADYLTQPYCDQCGSFSLRPMEGYEGTGVEGPNGEEEVRWEQWLECRQCGQRMTT